MDINVARKRLERMRDELDRSISILRGGAVPLAEAAGDAADAGANLSENDRIEAMLMSAHGQREGVLAALDRLEQGRYGLCVSCGRPIPEERLEARPDALRCVQCQSRQARRR